MGLSVCLCEFMCSMFVQEPAEVKVGVSSSGTGVAGSCKPLCGDWGLNLGPLARAVNTLNW